ncbi:MAG TPA: mechanosensitive ion channel family protein [Tepidisphaeraceae bacterium]
MSVKRTWGILFLVVGLALSLAAPSVRAQAVFLDAASHATESSTTGTTTTAAEPATSHLQVTARFHAGLVDLNWACDLPAAASFRIERSEHGSKSWEELKTVDAKVAGFQDTKVNSAGTYDYRVSALDTSGTVLESAVVTPIQKTLLNAFKGDVVTLQDMLDFAFWQQSVNTLVLNTLAFIPKLLAALILFAIFWLIYRMIRRIVLGSMNRAHVDSSIRDMLGSLIKWAVMGFGLVIACNQIGVEIAALLTGVSIIGLAIGFAAQETLANFIAGIVIFWDKPFRVGDWIIIDQIFGQVLRVSFRSTRLLDLNGETLVMPNTYMLANRVANHSTHPMIRIEIPIGIAYKESIDAARAALLSTVEGDDRICKEPAPSVVVAACADSSVNLLLRVWTREEAIERTVFYDYLERAKKALDAAHIEIPFPHMQLFLENTPAVSTLAGESVPSLR